MSTDKQDDALGAERDEDAVHDLGSDDEQPPVLELDIDGEDDEVFDLSSAEDREAVLAEALVHAATLEAQYRQPFPEAARSRNWKASLAVVVFILAGYLSAFPPPWLAGEQLPAVSQSAREQGVKAVLFLQAQQIEAFRVRQGRLPTTLEEAPVVAEGIRFVRSNNRVFQLVARGPGGLSIIYDSSRPVDEFVEAAAGWGELRP